MLVWYLKALGENDIHLVAGIEGENHTLIPGFIRYVPARETGNLSSLRKEALDWLKSRG